MARTVLDHTADTGVEATAASLEALVAELALAMFESMARVPAEQAGRRVTLEVDADTPEDLVVDTLSDLLYRSDTADLFFCDIRASIDHGDRLRATVDAGGVPTRSVDLEGPPIKAVTLHELVVEQRDDEWYGRVYLDV